LTLKSARGCGWLLLATIKGQRRRSEKDRFPGLFRDGGNRGAAQACREQEPTAFPGSPKESSKSTEKVLDFSPPSS